MAKSNTAKAETSTEVKGSWMRPKDGGDPVKKGPGRLPKGMIACDSTGKPLKAKVIHLGTRGVKPTTTKVATKAAINISLEQWLNAGRLIGVRFQ